MVMKFINSGSCEIDGEEMYYFQHPIVLRDNLIDTISKVGAVKFFSSPSEKIKKVRESMAEYFFILALEKATGQDWFLRQLKNDPPDFELMAAGGNLITLTLFELVEIPGRCQTFEEMMDIIQRKLKKGYGKGLSLLIFVNNEKSREWTDLLHQQLKNYHPFKEIWTVYLLWHKGKENLYGSMVNRLRPLPAKSVNAALNDPILRQFAPVPGYMEEIKIDGKTFLNPKPDFVKELTTKIRKINLARSQTKEIKPKEI